MTKTKNYFDFKLEGAAELDKVLAGLPQSVGRRMIIAGLKTQAQPILKDIRAAAPKDTGAAAKSIKIRVMKKSKFPGITIGPEAEFWWLKFHELGALKTRTQQPKPFMRPAWDAHKRTAAKGFILGTFKAIEKFAERLKKQAYAGKLSKAGRRALGL
jgi:HK97 gp10 family phage protein